MKTTHAVWERENIGVNAYEIALDANDTPEMLAKEEERIIAEGAEYIVLKTPVNCQQLIFGLPKLGYTFVEMVFHVMIRREDPAEEILMHLPENVPELKEGDLVTAYTNGAMTMSLPPQMNAIAIVLAGEATPAEAQ